MEKKEKGKGASQQQKSELIVSVLGAVLFI